jgi:hypothetical protein
VRPGPPLLPGDKYIATMFWPDLDPEEAFANYSMFKAEVSRNVKLEPSKPQAGLETLATIAIVASLISVGLTIVASFFKPKQKRPGSAETTQQAGQNIVGSTSYAPRSGFDSVQKPAGLLLTVPLVYAHVRGNIGGVRVAMPLLLSCIDCRDGVQMLRAIFMIGEGKIEEIDENNFAIGDTLLNGYRLPVGCGGKAP